MSFPLIKISLKFASITRIHVLATPLGYHPISCSLLYIGKKHYSAANRSRFIVKVCNHVTISDEINNLNLHCSTYYAHWCGEKKSVTINYKHGKLNIQLTPITQTQLLNSNCFSLPFRVWGTGVLLYIVQEKLYPRLSQFQGEDSSKRQNVLSKADPPQIRCIDLYEHLKCTLMVLTFFHLVVCMIHDKLCDLINIPKLLVYT